MPISAEYIQDVVSKYAAFSSVVTQLNQTLARRNKVSEEIKTSASPDVRELKIQEASQMKANLQDLEKNKVSMESELLQLAYAIPNSTSAFTPVGDQSKVKIMDYINEENQYTSSELAEPLDHVEICRRLDLVEFEAASRISGTGFYFLKNEAVLLELALTQYALKKSLAKGFRMVRCPDLIRSEFVPACGFQPRDVHGQQIYQTNDGLLSLVGTAEIPLAAQGVDKIFQESELPARFVAVGRAFRAEAGARGADTRGLYRVHEFTKIELFSFCKPSESDAELQNILKLQKSIVKELGLCARVLEMPTEELGASAHRKFDIEAWIPSRNDWGEITSASNCTDYQARRLNTRYKESQSSKVEFVHTVNGTAIAIPRLLVAGAETWYDHARIKVPDCLHRYMDGLSDIGVRDPPYET